ncbi:MAG: mercury methylation ferredoxin HgcB [Endomicrobiales bacterium]
MALRYLSGVATLHFDETKCTGCGRCLEVCPHAVFALEEGRARIADKDACIECGACQKNCLAGAATVRAGVGCAAAIISSFKKKKTSCSGDGPSCC